MYSVLFSVNMEVVKEKEKERERDRQTESQTDRQREGEGKGKERELLGERSTLSVCVCERGERWECVRVAAPQDLAFVFFH